MADIVRPEDTHRLMWEMSLGEFLDQAVRREPHKVFVEMSGHELTYSEFRQAARETAELFHSMGVGKGDRVCLLLPNCVEFLYCWFGLSLLGAISVPINTAYKRDETAYILNDAEACALVAHETLAEVAQEAADLAPSIRHRLLVAGGPPSSASREPGQEGWTIFSQVLSRSQPLASAPPVSPNDISMLVYTSGTTGNPKGVMVSHQMYVAAGQGFAHWTQATPEDRFFTCLPYYHANVQYYSTMGAMAAGATLVVADRFSASRFWDQVRQARATVVNFIGMMMPVLAKQPESPNDLDNLVRLFYGSPSFPPEFLAEFQERFGTDIIVGFGMTETCYGTIESIGETRRPGSSGQPRQHPDPRFVNQVRIAGAETGEPVGLNTVGEITITNPATMQGYWRNEEQTRQSLRDGWLFTGDLGWMDEDGFLYFVDRKKDIIRRRGENISSQEVEDVIKRHADVMDCAVIAVPSELGEDEVKAYVAVRPETQLKPEDIIHWCAQHLAYFKVPRYLEMRQELPRTPSLRVRKDLLRQEKEDLTQGCFDREAAGIQIR
ncbi:MAG: ATP-dependent acyl-CoA ligase [Chloroflexi bacterium]|nr:ATP-dependent acyl-CoA ligase [Chloroflexota bacterium]